MGHNRQKGGFAEAPAGKIEGYPDIPTSEALRQRPDPRAGQMLADARAEAAETGVLRPDFVELENFTPHKPVRPSKYSGGKPFKMVSDFEPQGDQPQAIKELAAGVKAAERDQVLLGVTGSGKTFTMAKVIEATQRPALILAHNKTLAA